MKSTGIFFLFYIIVGMTAKRLSKTSKDYFTEREAFEIEILDSENPKDKKKVYDIVFKNRAKIEMGVLELVAYKFLIDENLDRVEALKSKQEKGKEMNKQEEDVMVNIYMVDHYLEEIVESRQKYDRDFVEGILMRSKFMEYLHSTTEDMLFKVRDEVMRHPIAFDEMDFYQEFDL